MSSFEVERILKIMFDVRKVSNASRMFLSILACNDAEISSVIFLFHSFSKMELIWKINTIM